MSKVFTALQFVFIVVVDRLVEVDAIDVVAELVDATDVADVTVAVFVEVVGCAELIEETVAMTDVVDLNVVCNVVVLVIVVVCAFA